MITVHVPRPRNVREEDLMTIGYKMPLTANEYQQLAARTINADLTNKEILHHAALGLTSEAGEFAGLLQKVYQGHKYDKKHALKELGDCCWMIAEACTALNATLEEVMQMNIDKLKARYPEGFDPEKSLNRKEGDV